jgi:hypothetical protein
MFNEITSIGKPPLSPKIPSKPQSQNNIILQPKPPTLAKTKEQPKFRVFDKLEEINKITLKFQTLNKKCNKIHSFDEVNKCMEHNPCYHF